MLLKTVKRFECWASLSSDDGKVPTATEWPVYGDQQPYPPMIPWILENKSFICILKFSLSSLSILELYVKLSSRKSWSISVSIDSLTGWLKPPGAKLLLFLSWPSGSLPAYFPIDLGAIKFISTWRTYIHTHFVGRHLVKDRKMGLLLLAVANYLAERACGRKLFGWKTREKKKKKKRYGRVNPRTSEVNAHVSVLTHAIMEIEHGEKPTHMLTWKPTDFLIHIMRRSHDDRFPMPLSESPPQL